MPAPAAAYPSNGQRKKRRAPRGCDSGAASDLDIAMGDISMGVGVGVELADGATPTPTATGGTNGLGGGGGDRSPTAGDRERDEASSGGSSAAHSQVGGGEGVGEGRGVEGLWKGEASGLGCARAWMHLAGRVSARRQVGWGGAE